MTVLLRVIFTFAFALLVSSPLALAQGTTTPPAGGTTGGSTTSTTGCTYSYTNMRSGNELTGHAAEGETVKGRLATYVCHNGHMIKQGE
jgi:hypothetical protein